MTERLESQLRECPRCGGTMLDTLGGELIACPKCKGYGVIREPELSDPMLCPCGKRGAHRETPECYVPGRVGSEPKLPACAECGGAVAPNSPDGKCGGCRSEPRLANDAMTQSLCHGDEPKLEACGPSDQCAFDAGQCCAVHGHKDGCACEKPKLPACEACGDTGGLCPIGDEACDRYPQSQFCVACEGKPSGENYPCAVCGRKSPLAASELQEPVRSWDLTKARLQEDVLRRSFALRARYGKTAGTWEQRELQEFCKAVDALGAYAMDGGAS